MPVPAATDLSAVALDAATGRFNMPLELGLFLGCRRFGHPNQSKKRTLILDTDRYRYRNFISDIGGPGHPGSRAQTRSAPIREVRDWKRLASDHCYPAGSKSSCRIYAPPLHWEPDRLTFPRSVEDDHRCRKDR